MSKGTRTAEHATIHYRFGTAEFDPLHLELRVAGKLIDVQRKPLEILGQLLAHAGTIVTREQLLESVWNGRPVVDNVIANAVTKLRVALGQENAAALITHPKVGYRWCGVVESAFRAAPADLGAELLAGMLVPYRTDFSLLKKLYSATHNEVWTAHHNATGDLRVYKISRTREGLSALKREAALLQILQQSLGECVEIVRALEWNFEQAPFFIGYQFAGLNLAEWAGTDDRLTKLARHSRLRIFLKVVSAVQATHSAGVVHQDLKPSNIMVSALAGDEWQVRLTDFGSSRLMQSERLARMRITQFGLLNAEAVTSCSSSATPLYVAPELLAGYPANEQSDVYALGVLLYQLLVGDLRRPLAQGWERHVDDELLRDDIACATDCDPARRLSSVTELYRRIATLDERRIALADERRRELAVLQEREAELCRRARRGWMIATLIVSVVLLVQTALVAYDWFNSR